MMQNQIHLSIRMSTHRRYQFVRILKSKVPPELTMSPLKIWTSLLQMRSLPCSGSIELDLSFIASCRLGLSPCIMSMAKCYSILDGVTLTNLYPSISWLLLPAQSISAFILVIWQSFLGKDCWLPLGDTSGTSDYNQLAGCKFLLSWCF